MGVRGSERVRRERARELIAGWRTVSPADASCPSVASAARLKLVGTAALKLLDAATGGGTGSVKKSCFCCRGVGVGAAPVFVFSGGGWYARTCFSKLKRPRVLGASPQAGFWQLGSAQCLTPLAKPWTRTLTSSDVYDGLRARKPVTTTSITPVSTGLFELSLKRLSQFFFSCAIETAGGTVLRAGVRLRG